jgi:hypothetical protein
MNQRPFQYFGGDSPMQSNAADYGNLDSYGQPTNSNYMQGMGFNGQQGGAMMGGDQAGFSLANPNYSYQAPNGMGGAGDGSVPFFSTAGQQGWGGMAMGGASALVSAFMGMKQYGLAKKTLAENKRQFQLNYDAQKGMTNSRMEDRQRARVAAGGDAYQSVGAYMNQNGVK